VSQDRVGEKAVQAAHKTPPRPQFMRTTHIQLLLVLSGAPIAYFFAGASAVMGLAAGAACALLPQAYFAYGMLRASRQSAQQAARAGLAAEGGKFLLSAVSFALVFAVLKPERPELVFVGFGCALAVQLIAGIRLLRHPG